MWRAKVGILLGAVLFLLGCSEQNAGTPVAAVTPEVTVTVEVAPDGVTEDGYWNGAEWPDRPVYSMQHGISQTISGSAGDDASCGPVMRSRFRRGL